MSIVKTTSNTNALHYTKLCDDIIQLIEQGRNHVATAVNSTTVVLYWSIGQRINDDILKSASRADYGNQIIITLAQKLTSQFGKGYTRSSLFRMSRFYKLYPDKEIVATVSRQLSWSHIIVLCQLDHDLERDYYMQMSCIEGWSVRILRSKIAGMLFERTAISK